MKEQHAKHAADHKAHEKKPKDAKAEPAATAEIDQLKDRILRLQADYDNYRKRIARDQDEMASRANADLILKLLPIMDHFERGLRESRVHKADSSVIDGFQLIYDQFMSSLQKAGLVPLHAEGQMFDPNLHDATTLIPSEEHPADTIITETRRGYLLGGKLLRASQVVVSSGPAVPPSADAETLPDEPGEKAP